ncbi:hypothetical protein [Pseudomonas sp. GL-RE-26]|uniref:hypothetical protein n=1 Tax=Pseudomonas sp. GL-RE-26 TaxID=2832390 RepID=UPI001CBDD70A|nr:hypothetical protein [Pseudomonas sp. GL-RE-26]
MATDYSAGRYNVYEGRGPGAPLIGRIDEDEFVQSNGGLLYRIDGSEFYDMSGKYLGEIVESGEGNAMVIDGNHYCLFVIVPE